MSEKAKTVVVTRLKGGYLVHPWYDDSPTIVTDLFSVARLVQESFTDKLGCEVGE